jgi:hypothetical protein
MSWQAWAKELDKKLKGKRILARPKSWLYREAYYDDYDIDEAIELAENRKTTFKFKPQGWMIPK